MVEREPSKLEVAGSNPVSRSKLYAHVAQQGAAESATRGLIKSTDARLDQLLPSGDSGQTKGNTPT